EFDAELGTIGGGNHFAELQAVEQVYDRRAFTALGLDRNYLVALVHSGARGFAQLVWRQAAVLPGAAGLLPESEAGTAFLRAHDLAARWARANRELIAARFLHALEAEGEVIWDGCHSGIQARTCGGATVWVHRKGAIAVDATAVMIPGSRGALSYLVQPTCHDQHHAWSLAHGAGRKWCRSESRVRARERHRAVELVQTPLGGRVICGQRDLLYEEAPLAYKPIEDVIEALTQAGLAKVLATFRPLLTYKTRQARR